MPPVISSLSVVGGAALRQPWPVVVVRATDAAEIALSVDGGSTWGEWASYDREEYAVELPPAEGTHTIAVKVRDEASNEVSDTTAVTLTVTGAATALLDNMPAVYARDGVLGALFAAMAARYGHVLDSLDAAGRMMNLQTARGHWLSLWGRYCGVGRRSGEADTDYARRIVASISTHNPARVGLAAAAVDAASGAAVRIVEPAAYPGYVVAEVASALPGVLAEVGGRLRAASAAGVKVVVVPSD